MSDEMPGFRPFPTVTSENSFRSDRLLSIGCVSLGLQKQLRGTGTITGVRLTAGDLLTLHRAGCPTLGGVSHSLQIPGGVSVEMGTVIVAQ